MKAGDYVVQSMGPAEYEPRMYQVRSIGRGRAELVRVNPTDGVATETIQVDVYNLRSYRYLSSGQQDDFRRLVLDLRRQRAACRDFIVGLPLMADVSS